MKIVATMLIASIAIPIGVNLAASSGIGLIDLTPPGVHAFFHPIYSLTHNLSSEPAMMILLGTGLIGMARIGRKKISEKEYDLKSGKKFGSEIPHYPDPVPWKKDN